MSHNLVSSHLVVSFLFIAAFHLFPLGHGDFRFCLNGPQVMRDTDCPGGFIFKDGIKSTCKYYSKTGSHEGIVLSAPVDICDDSTLRAIENGGDDLADIETLNYLLWEEMDTTNNGTDGDGENASLTNGTTAADMCQSECLEEWVDTSIVPDEEPIPEDWDPSNVTEEDKKYCRQLNRKMFLRLLLDDDDSPDVKKVPKRKGQSLQVLGRTDMLSPMMFPEDENEMLSMEVLSVGAAPPTTTTTTPPPPSDPFMESSTSYATNFYNSLIATAPYDSSQLNIIKMLAQSMKIMASACSPFLREDFFEQVLRGMMLISKMNEENILDVGQDAYIGITKLLDSCGQKKFQEFALNGTLCEGEERIEGIYNIHSEEYWKYRLTGRSFRWGNYHPVLDAAWTIIDFIHSFCFDNFMKNMMYGHVFALSMEELFPKKVQVCWRLEADVKNDKFWNNVLQTNDLNTTMRNLDACAIAARMSSPFLSPLPRPFLSIDEMSRTGPNTTADHLPQKGWNKTIEQYWIRYEKKGGFKKMSSEFGKCYQEHHFEEQEELIESLKKGCAGS